MELWRRKLGSAAPLRTRRRVRARWLLLLVLSTIAHLGILSSCALIMICLLSGCATTAVPSRPRAPDFLLTPPPPPVFQQTWQQELMKLLNNATLQQTTPQSAESGH